MCSNQTHSFARAIEKWFAGLREVSYNDTKRVSGKEFKKLFPSESRAFSYDFRKMKSINDNDLYYIAKVDGAMRPITRQVSFTETAAPTKCGGLCRNAKGPSCDCSCKGVNHGAGSVFSRSKDSITMTPKKSPHSRFARSSASTKALHTIYNYLEVVRTEWGEDRGIEAGRELQKAAKAIAADPSSQDIAAEIAQLVRVATTDKSYDKRDRALDDLESIINQAQSQHARRKGKTSMAQAGFTVPPEVKERTLAKNKADALKLINDNIRYLENLSQHPPDQYAGQVNNLANIYLEAGEGHIADSNWKGYLSNQESHVLVEKINRAFEKLNEHGFHVTMHSRSGVKARFDRRVELDQWTSPKGTRYIAGFHVGFNGDTFHPFVSATFSDGGEQLMSGNTPSFRSEKGARKWLAKFMERMYSRTGTFSRSGVKAKFGQPNTVSVRKTPRGGFEVFYWDANGKEQSFSLHANEEHAKERAKDLARQLGMQFVAGRSRFGIAERVLNDGSVHLDFKVFRESLSGKSDSSLNFIMRDAADARDAMGPDGKKFNYYADIVNEVGDEIARRKNGKSRSNRSGDRKQSFEAGDSFMVEGYVGDAITGGRSARTMEEAEHYANAMLAMIKRNAGGKPVKVEIQEIKAYSPQGVIKTMHSRGESKISTRFGSIASKLGFLPDSITESNGVATLKFAQADGSAGRCAFAMIRPLTGIVGSDRVTATDTEVRVQFARGGKAEFGEWENLRASFFRFMDYALSASAKGNTTLAEDYYRQGTRMMSSHPDLNEEGSSTRERWMYVGDRMRKAKSSRSGGSKTTFGSDVILEDIGDDQVRATARVEGRSAGSFDGPRNQSAQLLLKALKIAGQGHEVSSGVYDMTYITLNDAAKRAMPKSAMMSRGGKAEFAMGDPAKIADNLSPNQRAEESRYLIRMHKLQSAATSLATKMEAMASAAEWFVKDITRGGLSRETARDMDDLLLNAGNISNRLKVTASRSGGKAEFAQANQQIADGVAQLLSVLGFAAMAEEAKTATDADTLKRYINVARRRIKGSDQSDRFNTLADKLERMLMSRKGKAEFGEIGSGGSYVSNALHHISNDIARGDKDMAKAMMRKLAERIGKESHTDAEWNQYLSLARSLGFSDNAVAGFSRGDEKSESFKKLLSQNVSRSNLAQMEKTVDKAITYAKKVGDDELLDLAEETGIECSALRSRASRLGTKTRFEMDQTTHRHLMTWIDNQLGNRAGSAGYIADKMIGQFNDDPEHWENQGWSKVFDAAGLSSADFNNPKKGWD